MRRLKVEEAREEDGSIKKTMCSLDPLSSAEAPSVEKRREKGEKGEKTNNLGRAFFSLPQPPRAFCPSLHSPAYCTKDERGLYIGESIRSAS